jgi:carbonic anhydrase
VSDTLLSQLLAASWARRDGRKAAPPRLRSGADVLILTCTEPGAGADGAHLTRLFALPPGRVHIVRSIAARAPSSTGEVAHSIGAALSGTLRSEVLVIGHAGCRFVQGAGHGVDFSGALGGRFSSVEEAVRASVRTLQANRFLPAGTAVHGLVVEPDGAELTLVEDGYWAATAVDAAMDDLVDDLVGEAPDADADHVGADAPEESAGTSAEGPETMPEHDGEPDPPAAGAADTAVELELDVPEPPPTATPDHAAERARAVSEAFSRAEEVLRARLGPHA